MSIFGIIFWLWLAVSIVMLVQRRVKRRAERRGNGAQEPVRAEPAGGDQTGGDEPPDHPDSEHRMTADGDSDEGRSEDQADGTGATENQEQPESSPSESGPSPSTRNIATPGARAADLSEALTGIKMPCDLAPLTLGTGDMDPVHVDLVTTGSTPAEVTTQLNGELARLGYEVADLGGGEYLASRGETVVRVRVHDRPSLSVGADGRGFPTAPEDGIVVEVTLT